MQKLGWSVLLLLVAGGVAWWQWQGQAPSQAAGETAAPVVAFTVTQQSFSDRIEALGTLQGSESVTITSTVAETVASIHFEEGRRVEQGELLVALSQDEERAQLAAARADLAEQQREVRRLEGLVKNQSAAQTDLDQRRTAREKARHRIEELQATIADRNLRAPFAGVTGLRQVSPGALVSPGDTITTLDAVDTLKLDFSVPATALASLSAGQEVTATTAAYDREFNGTVTVVDSRVNPVDRSIRARALFDNPEGLLKPGMLMQLTLHYRPRQTLLIPEEALVSRDRDHFVWVIDPQTRSVSRREVAIGSRRPGWVEVTEGLKAGEKIVREGLLRMRPGATVTVKAES